MMRTRDRRTLAAGLLVVVCLVTVFRGIPAWRRWDRATREEALALANTLRTVRAAIADEARQAREQEQRQTHLLAYAPWMIGGNGASAAAATVASRLNGVARSNHAEMGSARLLPDSTTADEPFEPVRIAGTLHADVRGLSGFLGAVQRGPPLLAIRALAIEQPDPGRGDESPERLQISFVLEGLTYRSVSDSAR